jgi:hypothetical protein
MPIRNPLIVSQADLESAVECLDRILRDLG